MKGHSSPSQLIHLSHLRTTENHKQATTQPLSLNTFCKPLHNGISGNLSPTNHNPNSVIRSTNHCCFISILATLEEGD
ncbi:hypothetical protein Bca4012_099367 [Brassica carinata]